MSNKGNLSFLRALCVSARGLIRVCAEFALEQNLTSAVLDRLLHHAETVIVEGRSYRMKDQVETP
jgi:uncharacterized protein (DUF1778 family)